MYVAETARMMIYNTYYSLYSPKNAIWLERKQMLCLYSMLLNFSSNNSLGIQIWNFLYTLFQTEIVSCVKVHITKW